jgi:hypothetical protein
MEQLEPPYDVVFGFGAIKNFLEPYYSSTGRPSIDPELMIGYC